MFFGFVYVVCFAGGSINSVLLNLKRTVAAMDLPATYKEITFRSYRNLNEEDQQSIMIMLLKGNEIDLLVGAPISWREFRIFVPR